MKNIVKKVITAVLTICLLTAFSEAAVGAAEREAFSAWISDGFIKVLGSDKAPETPKHSFTVYAAGNEKESCQISMRSGTAVNGLSVKKTKGSFKGIRVDLFFENVLLIDGEEWPDALSPLTDSFDLPASKTRSVLIRFSVDAGVKAGDYAYEFTVKSGKGTLAVISVTLHKWGFDYPEAPTMATAIGLERQSFAYQYHYITHASDPIPASAQAKVDELYKQYYDFLLDNKMSAIGLPYDILDSRADAYMSDPRVTGIYISHEYDDATIVKIYNKLKTNPVWLAKAYMYPVDEPTSKEMLDDLKSKVTHFRQLCPEVRFATSFFRNVDYDKNTDEITFLSEVLDILCIKTKCWEDSEMYSSAQAKKYPAMTQRTRSLQKSGDTIWSYVCWEPGHPFANLYVNEPGIDHRILFWQQYDVGSEGFLYWAANFWKCVTDPWTSMATVSWLDPHIYGDGALLYNGNKVGVDGPCASKRFEAVRDGIEDYELLTLAEKRLGAEWINAQIDMITRSMVDYTDNNALFSRVRTAIGNALENGSVIPAGETAEYDLTDSFRSEKCGKGTIRFAYGTGRDPFVYAADPAKLTFLDTIKEESAGNYTSPNWMNGRMYKSGKAGDVYAHFLRNDDNGMMYLLPQKDVMNAIVFTAPKAGYYAFDLTCTNIWDAADTDLMIYAGSSRLSVTALKKGANNISYPPALYCEAGDTLLFFFVHNGTANGDIRIDSLKVTGITETAEGPDTPGTEDTGRPDTTKKDPGAPDTTRSGGTDVPVTTGRSGGETTEEPAATETVTAAPETVTVETTDEAPAGTEETTGTGCRDTRTEAEDTAQSPETGDREEKSGPDAMRIFSAAAIVFAVLLIAAFAVILVKTGKK